MFDYFEFVNKVLVIIINLTGIWLSIWVYLANRKESINKGLALFIVPNLLWIDFYNLAFLTYQYDLRLLLIKLTFASVFIYTASMYYLPIIWLLKDRGWYSKLGKIILIYSIFFSFLCVFTNSIITHIKVSGLNIAPSFSLLGKISFHFYIIILVIIIIRRLAVKYFQYPKQEQIKIQYFLMGFSFFVCGTFLFGVFLPLFFNNHNFYHYANYLSVFLFGFTTLAIIKQNLFNIKAVLTTFFVGAMAILLGIDIIAFTPTTPLRILKTIILFVFVWLGYSLVRNVKQEMERRAVLEKLTKELEAKTANLEAKTHDLQSLLDIAKVATLSLKTKEVTQKILNSIPKKLKHLGYIGGLLTLRDDENKRLRTYAVTQTPLIQKALDILNKPFEKYSILLKKRNSLLLKTLRDGKISFSDKIEDFISPPVPKKIAQATQKIIGMKAGIGVPIKIHGKIEGVIMFAAKKKIGKINQRDEEIMTAFANHLGLTIENSKLFEETIQKEKQLQKTNKKLAELAEAKSNFLAVASHQLRTPVSIVKGMLSMLIDGSVPKEKERQFIERSFANLERLSNIIHDLLSAGAVEGTDFKLNKKIAQINNIITKVVEEKTEKAKEKNLELIYNQPQTPIPPFRIDDNKIMEVIENLIDNAIQYTQTGKIEIDTEVENNHFVFKIKDTGIGIKEKNFPKLFKKISRLPNAISVRPDGTGLGLYLVKHIIKAHNGKVDVKSSGVNGEGSEFSFWLPM